MEENQYRQLLNKAPFGYAYHKLVLNEDGIPIDYIFLEVNEAFEQLTGLKANKILNKKVTEVIPNIREGNFDWIKNYGDITLNKETKEFEHFFIPLNKWYKITASSTDSEHFTAIFTDISANQIIANKLQELIDSTAHTIDYTKICEAIREISGARYVILNKFEPNGKDFTTMAIAGITELTKITEMLGFDVIKKQWKYDPDRELRIQNNKTTAFKSLSDLTGKVVPESIANLIQHTFNLSEFYLIKTMRDHIAIGDCTLFFKKGTTFQNKELTETFVDAIGITLSRIANEELLIENELRYLELAQQNETITWEINKAGVYTFISPFIENLLGYTAEEVVGKMHFYDLHPEKNEGVLLSASLQLFINRIPINNLANALQTKSNEIIWVNTTCLPLFDKQGEIIGYRGTDTNITEQKLSERKIAETTNILQKITDNMNDVIFLLDLNLNVTYISPSIERVTGFSPEMYKTRKKEDIYTEASLNKLYSLFDKEMENEKDPNKDKKRIAKIELEEYIADGSIIWISVFVSFIYNEKGVLTGFSGSSRNITDRKQAENILRDSEEKFAKAFNNSPTSIIITRAQDGKIIDINESFISLSGYSKEEALLVSSKDLWVNIEDRDSVISSLNLGVEIKNKEFQFKIKNNTIIDVLFSAQLININSEPYLISNILDITEKKVAENKIKESERKYRSLIENSSDTVFCVNEKGEYQFVNQLFAKTFEKTPEYFIGKTFWDIYDKEHANFRYDATKRLFQTGISETFEIEVPLPDKTLYFQATTNPIKDDSGKIIYMLTHSSNITERKQMETLLEQTRTNFKNFFNSINDFLFVLDEQGNIIHVNNTVLNRLEYSLEELIGQSVLIVHPKELQHEAQKVIGEMLDKTTEFCSIPIITKSGVQILVETRVSHGKWDNKPAIFGISTDISKTVLSEEKFSKVFYLNPSACGLSDMTTHQYVEVNDAFYTLLGFTKDEVIGKTAEDLGILTAEKRANIMNHANTNGNLYNVEAELKAKNGDIKHTLFSTETITIQENTFIYTVVQDITERKLAEKNQIIFSSLIQNSSTLFVVKDLDFRIIAANKAFLQATNFNTIEEIIGKNDAELLGIPENSQTILDYKFDDYTAANLALGETISNEEFIQTSKGLRTSLTQKFPIYDNDNKLIGIGVMSTDITESKKKEQMLIDSQSVAKIGSYITYLGSSEFTENTWEASQEIYKIFGIDKDYPKTLASWVAFIHPDSKEELLNYHEKVVTEHLPFNHEYKIIRISDGEERWVHGTGETTYDKTGNPIKMQGAIQDITERKQAELDLITAKKETEESEQRFKIASRSANLGIWDWNVRDNTMIWDERMYELYGVEKESTLKTIDLWITGLHPEDKDAAITACNDALEGKSTFDTTFRVKHPNGNVLYLKADGLVIMSSENKAIRMIGVNRDITESKQTEEYRTLNMEIMQKLNAKNTLKDSIHNVLTILKTHLKFDAIGIRLQAGEDFPYYTQNGFSEDFLLTENSLLERNSSGGICRNPDGSACLECTCGLVVAGTADLTNPLFTKGGSAWTNDSFQLLDIPLADDPRHNPRNTCMHKGYGSLALIPIKANNIIIGLIQVNNKLKGQLDLELIEFLETTASNIGSSLLRKKAEENLQINEQKQTTMISNISDVIGIIGTDGLIKYKSPNITKYFGWLASDLFEADAWSTVHPDDLERCQQAFYSLIQENKESITIEYKYKCKDGTYKPIKLTATNLINDPFVAGILLNYHDITDRQLSEKTLQESEEKFRKAFMTSLDAIAINRLEDGMYISINDGFTKILDYSPDEIIGKTSVELNIWNNINDRKKLTQELLKNSFVENFETRFQDKNGILKDGLMSASIINLNGTKHILSNTRDITERKKTENHLQKYATKLEQSNKELAEFVYIASHDLKEPLRGISNCASFIKMDHPKLEVTVTTKINHIIELAERLDIFINELLAFSKIGNTDILFDNYKIKDIVEESIENICSCGFYTNSEIIINDFPDTAILCNKERIKYVYQNLITNGLKYNTNQHKRIEIGSFYENNQTVYYVYDNGIGIEEKHQEIIFQIFKRLHPKEDFSGGTGVGLAIVKKVILQHHGNIWLKSAPNQGTTFYFTLNVKKD